MLFLFIYRNGVEKKKPYLQIVGYVFYNGFFLPLTKGASADVLTRLMTTYRIIVHTQFAI